MQHETLAGPNGDEGAHRVETEALPTDFSGDPEAVTETAAEGDRAPREVDDLLDERETTGAAGKLPNRLPGRPAFWRPLALPPRCHPGGRQGVVVRLCPLGCQILLQHPFRHSQPAGDVALALLLLGHLPPHPRG